MQRSSRLPHIAALTLLTLAVAACGGGGGGGSSLTPPFSGGGSTSSSSSSSSASSSSTGWVSGLFQAASTFANKCQTPRTGVDSEGNAFPDTAGTSLDEKNWLRSWTHETYLWNTEVVDTDPALGGTPVDYFNTLKTNAITASGKAKDQFHFSEPTADTLARADSAAEAGYGADFVILAGSPPRDVRVAYTEPGSPAEDVVDGHAKLVRGSQILTADGIDVVNGASTQAQVDALNAALFPDTAGVTTTLVVRDPGASATRTVTLTSADIAESPVNRTRVLDDGAGHKTGYILFNTFSPYASEKALSDAMQGMKDQGVGDLVIDLRYNGGGLLAVASELGYMVAGDARTSGRTFDKLRFNAAAGNLDPVTGEVNEPVPFYNTGVGFSVADGTALPTLNLGRVFVLTTDNTCSASEAVINGLRGVGVDVIQVGGKTCGKPYGFYPQDNCGTTYYSIQFQGTNDAGFGDFADGFEPQDASDPIGVKIDGCSASDDYDHDLGDAGEGMLSTALSYASTGTCPAAAHASTARLARGVTATGTGPELVKPVRSVMDDNLDMRLRP